ncbi:unnamed protein product, partial [Musa hybrid cultivar]
DRRPSGGNPPSHSANSKGRAPHVYADTRQGMVPGGKARQRRPAVGLQEQEGPADIEDQ